MNTDTGEIIRLKKLLELEKDLLLINEAEPIEIVNSLPDGFTQVPDDLTEEAEKVLQGQDHAFADLTQDTPLTRWARQDRKSRAATNSRRKRNRKLMQKASKIRNRK
jgi:hypothetical protein